MTSQGLTFRSGRRLGGGRRVGWGGSEGREAKNKKSRRDMSLEWITAVSGQSGGGGCCFGACI